MSDEAEPEGFNDYAAAFDALAGEIDALVAEDNTGGGLLLCHMRDAAEEVRGANIDAAMLSLDAAEAQIEAIREQLRSLARGELPR